MNPWLKHDFSAKATWTCWNTEINYSFYNPRTWEIHIYIILVSVTNVPFKTKRALLCARNGRLYEPAKSLREKFKMRDRTQALRGGSRPAAQLRGNVVSNTRSDGAITPILKSARCEYSYSLTLVNLYRPEPLAIIVCVNISRFSD